MMNEDAINPSHYKAPGTPDVTVDYPVECIDVVEQLPFCLGNAIKYVWRCGRKPGADPVEDLRKAIWYLERQLKVGLIGDCWLSVEDMPCEAFEIAEAMNPRLGQAMLYLWPYGRMTDPRKDIGYAIREIRIEIARLEAERKEK